MNSKLDSSFLKTVKCLFPRYLTLESYFFSSVPKWFIHYETIKRRSNCEALSHNCFFFWRFHSVYMWLCLGDHVWMAFTRDLSNRAIRLVTFAMFLLMRSCAVKSLQTKSDLQDKCRSLGYQTVPKDEQTLKNLSSISVAKEWRRLSMTERCRNRKRNIKRLYWWTRTVKKCCEPLYFGAGTKPAAVWRWKYWKGCVRA